MLRRARSLAAVLAEVMSAALGAATEQSALVLERSDTQVWIFLSDRHAAETTVASASERCARGRLPWGRLNAQRVTCAAERPAQLIL